MTVIFSNEKSLSRTDVYFLADTTASMGSILAAVKEGGNDILASLAGLEIDIAIGVGNYKDFTFQAPAFQHQLAPTLQAAGVTAAINAWEASGGLDLPEGQLSALDALAEAPGGFIGWRDGARRIIVWFGDAPGHDPVCAAISGLPYDITEASVTAKLKAQGITVLAISTDTGVIDALDGDPSMGRSYSGACGPAGGQAGQATRIANATGGRHVSGANAKTIVAAITDLITSTSRAPVPTGGGLPNTPTYLKADALNLYVEQVREQLRALRQAPYQPSRPAAR